MRDTTDIGTFSGAGLVVHDLSPRTRRAAALTVCDRARDAAEARVLLGMCGLLGDL